MNKRPTSVSVIAWIIIVFSILGFIALPLSYVSKKTLLKLQHSQINNPQLDQHTKALLDAQTKKIEANLQTAATPGIIATGMGLMILFLVSGIGMLKGKRWARTLYIILAVISILMTLKPLLAAYSAQIMVFVVIGAIIRICIYGIILIFLFRPAANRYFSGNALTASAPPPL